MGLWQRAGQVDVVEECEGEPALEVLEGREEGRRRQGVTAWKP